MFVSGLYSVFIKIVVMHHDLDRETYLKMWDFVWLMKCSLHLDSFGMS